MNEPGRPNARKAQAILLSRFVAEVKGGLSMEEAANKLSKSIPTVRGRQVTRTNLEAVAANFRSFDKWMKDNFVSDNEFRTTLSYASDLDWPVNEKAKTTSAKSAALDAELDAALARLAELS